MPKTRRFALILASTWALSAVASSPAPTPQAQVAIDIGHFPDPPEMRGAKGASGIYEYTRNKALAAKVGAALTVRNITHVFTEGTLGERPKKAAEHGVALFVSIHHDSVQEFRLKDVTVPGNRYRGFSVFVSKENPKFAASLACASRIGAAQVAASRQRSLYHADKIEGGHKEFLDEANGVHRYDRLAVLRHTTMPALLFEAGVIANPEDEADTIKHHDKIAQALAEGIQQCLKAG